MKATGILAGALSALALMAPTAAAHDDDAEIFATNNTAVITDPADPRLQDRLKGFAREVERIVEDGGARALERGRAGVAREDAVEQARAARAAASLTDQALHRAGERLQVIVEARVRGIGDHRGVVGGEDLGVLGGRCRCGDRQEGERTEEWSDHGPPDAAARLFQRGDPPARP